MHIKGFFYFFIFCISMLGFSERGFAQKPDYKRIKKQISKKKSDYYYPKLVKKFSRGLQMSTKDKQYLYYGYAFFGSYTPYKEYKYRRKINKLINENNFTKENLLLLENYINFDLVEHPFDIQLHKIQLFIYKRLRNTQKAIIKERQIQIIINAILSSGDGLSPNNAYAVIFVSNEYDILDFLKLKKEKNSFIDKNLEYIKVASNKSNIKGLYFDVSFITKKMNAKRK